MARKLDAFPAPPSQRYPWSEWLNGDVWQLFQGDDYSAKASTVITNARSQAKRRGGSVRTRLAGDDGRESIILRFERP